MEKIYLITYYINGQKNVINEIKEKINSLNNNILMVDVLNTTDENNDQTKILIEIHNPSINIDNIINDETIKNNITIAYKLIDENNNVFQIHNINNEFDDECYVITFGEPFQTIYNNSIKTIKNAVEEWFVKMNANINNLKQGYNEATQNNGSEPDFYQYMMELINNFDYQKHEIKPYYKINLFEYI